MPAKPVVPDAMLTNKAGDSQRRIGGKSGRHHAGAQHPPGQAAARQKILLGRGLGTLAENQAQRPEMMGHQGRGALLLIRALGMSVNIPSHLHHPRGYLLGKGLQMRHLSYLLYERPPICLDPPLFR